MMYNENLHEEEQHLIQQIAEQTERGKIDWARSLSYRTIRWSLLR